MSALLDLAARVEAMGEPDREMFEDIWRIVFPKPAKVWEDQEREEPTVEYEKWSACQHHFYDLIDAEAFLDAAMTLVGDHQVTLTSVDDDWFCIIVGQFGGSGCAPALALTAAALRAKAGQP